jgi:hypothetical protein
MTDVPEFSTAAYSAPPEVTRVVCEADKDGILVTVTTQFRIRLTAVPSFEEGEKE